MSAGLHFLQTKIPQKLRSMPCCIHAALEAEKRFIANPDQMRDYWQREKAIMERVSELAAAKDEGRAEEKESVARTMLSDNVPIQQIQKYTGLSASEIEALQK